MADIKNVYCLDFKVKSGEDSESSSVTLYPGGIVSEVKIDGKSYSLSLNSLDFSKRAYEPCHVRADIKIAMSGETGELPALQKTVDYFASFSSVMTMRSEPSPTPARRRWSPTANSTTAASPFP